MADATRPAIGLSIGATNLAAVTADRSVSRKPVLTLYGQRPPEVGVPSENPRLDEPGLVITDFVNKVGSAAQLVATDGSTHRSEVLVADALRALVTDGAGKPEAPKEIVVTYPAHWQPGAVAALRGALAPGSGWLNAEEPVLLDDNAAAVNALQTNPGLPGSGIIVVCDFGGSGTNLSLVDAANGYQRIGATVRHADFSGDLIDQAVLNHVVADLSAAGSFDTSATSAIGSLTRLRADCRHAKEQLSVRTVTTLTAELPGFRGDLHLTRAELDEVIRQPLAAFVAVIRDVLQHSGIQPSDVAAVAAVGGGANIPVVAATLSDQLRTPVVTAPRPQLIPAIGAALWAARGPADPGATALAPAVDAVAPPAEPTTVLEPAPATSDRPALAWSEAEDTGVSPLLSGEYPAEGVVASPAPAERFEEDRDSDPDGSAKVPWYRRTVVLILAAAVVLAAIAGAIMLALRHTSSTTPVTPAPSTTAGPSPTASAPETTASQNPTETQPSLTSQAPSTTSQAPSSTTSTTTTTTEPSTTQTSTSQVTTTEAPPFPPNRVFGPEFPRGPEYPEPGQGPGVQEPGRGGR
jgi:hypothetical protein